MANVDYVRTRVQVWPGVSDRLFQAVELVADNLPSIKDQIWDAFYKRYGDPADMDTQDDRQVRGA